MTPGSRVGRRSADWNFDKSADMKLIRMRTTSTAGVWETWAIEAARHRDIIAFLWRHEQCELFHLCEERLFARLCFGRT